MTSRRKTCSSRGGRRRKKDEREQSERHRERTLGRVHGRPWAAAALQHTGAAAFGGVRRPAGKQALQQAQRELGENIREGSRRRNIREGARQENIRECSRTEHRDRSRCKINNEGVQRETAPGPELHTRCAQKLFKEALQRSSSEKLFTKKQEKSAFTAVHGSAIEGGCCDSNATVHARGYGQDGD